MASNSGRRGRPQKAMHLSDFVSSSKRQDGPSTQRQETQNSSSTSNRDAPNSYRDAPTSYRSDNKPRQSASYDDDRDDRSREVCRFWAAGKSCKFGSQCRYAHPASTSARDRTFDDSRSGRVAAASSQAYLASLPKERGRISGVNPEKGFGFISPYSGSHSGKTVFYHISDVENNEVLKEKDEVEFSVVPDKYRPDDLKAINIKLIGRITINATEKEKAEAAAAVEDKKKEDVLPSFRPAWMTPSSGSTSTPTRSASASDASPSPYKSETSSLTTISNDIDLRPRGSGAGRSQFGSNSFGGGPSFGGASNYGAKPKGVPEGQQRERGVIAQVKDNFGFIKCNAFSARIFYHLKECEQNEQFQEGDEVEFFVQTDPMTKTNEFKATAVRLVQPIGLFGNFDDRELINPPAKHGLISDKSQLDRYAMLDWIKKMSHQDSEMMLLHVNELENIVNQDELSFAVIHPLLDLLTRPSLRDSDRMDKVFTIVVESKFMRHPRNFRSYILKLSETTRGKGLKESNVTLDFQAVVTLLQEIMERLSPSYYQDLPLDALQAAAQKLQRGSLLSPATISTISRLIQLREQRKSQLAQHYQTREWTPQGEEEDFRNISVFPSTEEILEVESGQLSSKISPNIVDGKYKNVMHYLDTHFRLLREDCIQPLREGIKSYIATKQNSTGQISRDIRIYHDVNIKGIQCGRQGIVYRVAFRLDCDVQWERSKRLMYGSLLCLSCDDFKTLLWATVANRDSALLTSSSQIDIKFPVGFEKMFSSDQVYTMAESSTTYFEAYQHVLKALQGLDIDNFSFADYLISCNPAVKAPSYLRPRTHDNYNLGNVFEGGTTNFSILEKWPLTKVDSSMDDSQMDALAQSLTKELAIVQGPPGTGKTFVGLKVMRALLDNRHYRKQNPILVICYTNHALDQFLEGVLKFEDSIVRIGGRSKSEHLKERNIRKLMYEAGKTGKQHRRSRYDINQQLDQLSDEIQSCVAELNRRTIGVSEIKKVATGDQMASLFSRSKNLLVKKSEEEDMLKFWLAEMKGPLNTYSDKNKNSKAPQINNGRGANVPAKAAPQKQTSAVKPQRSRSAEDFAGELDDEDEEIIAEMQSERMAGEDEFEAQHHGKVMQLSETVVISKEAVQNIPEEVKNCTDVWKLGTAQRHLLYRFWVSRHRQNQTEGDQGGLLFELCQRYEDLCRERQVLEEELQIEVLAKAAVIGVTTTGVAKFQRLFKSVQPEVIIVEEAAEVLEAHIVAALSPATKHLILIGDHEQLRPSTAVYRLSVQYNLDVSLFERLVRNGLEQVTLSRQRRMRPAISSLISSIYPKLEDHQRVSEYPNVMGVFSNTFFLHHVEAESSNHDSTSKSNEHEALFFTRFCNYLLLQGYKPDQITVLTAYSGQVHLLRKEFRKFNLGSVKITSVDNYQGEENDIILLSLVRSNKNGEIGFLKTSNRICVALSRAKHGLYVIGNANLLSKNQLWRSVIETFKRQGAFGTSLKLQCQNHTAKYTDVAYAEDFNNAEDGGCNKECRQVLACGHICPRFCHPYTHDLLQCTKPCIRKHEACGHSCTKRCYEPCGECTLLVEKQLPCGHSDKVECYLPPEEHTCTKPCERKLNCKKHTCPKLCGERCPTFCHVPVEKDLKCGHKVAVECGQDISKMKCSNVLCQKGIAIEDQTAYQLAEST
eukprot:TRINITY_DN2745_c0_g1_i2.p1 TRINITY_DN2745_c0_g1~~TRINITY_DN2745_c0_g1_i2.p1  ORF type:complete len:1671 (+),score=513.90 TRINITY_DN2745_c0_g1_i2:432-5444(+)